MSMFPCVFSAEYLIKEATERQHICNTYATYKKTEEIINNLIMEKFAKVSAVL